MRVPLLTGCLAEDSAEPIPHRKDGGAVIILDAAVQPEDAAVIDHFFSEIGKTDDEINKKIKALKATLSKTNNHKI